ncbi:MAG: hypothetical protein HOL49_12675 [Gammaproteobacteria bacterium]|nr:hypothetical protein [Gammaproteobacteria bacterium]
MHTRKSALLKGALLLCGLVALYFVGYGLVKVEIQEADNGSSSLTSSNSVDVRGSLSSYGSKPKDLRRNLQNSSVEGATNTSSLNATLTGEFVGMSKDLRLEGLVVNRPDMPENLLPLEHAVANKISTLPSILDPDTNLPMRDRPAAISSRGQSIYDPDSYIPGDVRKEVKPKNAPERWIDNPGEFLPRGEVPGGNKVSGQYVGDPEEHLPEYR